MRIGAGATRTLFVQAPAAAFAGAFCGCLTTLDLAAFGIVPGIASALVTTLLCGLFLIIRATSVFPNAFFWALYGGSFAGMTSDIRAAAPMSVLFIALSIVCGLAFLGVAGLDRWRGAAIGSGYGGRAGAVAAVASSVFLALTGLWGADADRLHVVSAGALSIEPLTAGLELVACLAGTFGTVYVLRQQWLVSAEEADRVFFASVVALVGLTALHLMSPDDTRVLDAFYAGCFLGMSTPRCLKGRIEAALGALVLTPVLILVRAYLPGVGGSLGFAAFITVALLMATHRMTAWMAGKLTRAKQQPLPDASAPAPDQAAPPQRAAA
jgi:hypothetical protein